MSFKKLIDEENEAPIKLKLEHVVRYFNLTTQSKDSATSTIILCDLFFIIFVSVAARCDPIKFSTVQASFHPTQIYEHFNLRGLYGFYVQLLVDSSKLSLADRISRVASAKKQIVSMVSSNQKPSCAPSPPPPSVCRLERPELATRLFEATLQQKLFDASLTVIDFTSDQATKVKFAQLLEKSIQIERQQNHKQCEAIVNKNAPKIELRLDSLDDSKQDLVRKAAQGHGLVKMLLLGNSGSGKSRMFNLLCSKNIFESGTQAAAVTRHASAALISQPKLFNKKLLLIDTPGVIESDTKRIDDNRKEIVRAIRFLPEVPSAIVIVFNGSDRVSSSDKELAVALRTIIKFQASQGVSLIVNNFPSTTSAETELRLKHEFASYAEKCIGIKTMPCFIPHCVSPGSLSDPFSKESITARASVFLAADCALSTAQIITLSPDAQLKLERHTLMEKIKNNKIEQDFQKKIIEQQATSEKQQFQARMQAHKERLQEINERISNSGC